MERIPAGIRHAAIVIALAGSGVLPARADVHWRIGVGVAPYGWGWNPGWYGDDPPMIVVPPPQPVIVMPRQPVYVAPPPVLGAPPPAYWYYCGNPAGYYPQVQRCPGGWTPVLAQPAR